MDKAATDFLSIAAIPPRGLHRTCRLHYEGCFLHEGTELEMSKNILWMKSLNQLQFNAKGLEAL